MDDCVDCGRQLQDLICRSCSMIYIQSMFKDMVCLNCGELIKSSRSHRSIRHQCHYCRYRYFVITNYDPDEKEKLLEFMNSLEMDCVECGATMSLNPMNQELVCKQCGLVHEQPIYTRL